MGENQQPQQQMQTSDLIAKAASKGKFLDFRNNLIAARTNEYAMIHGIGGKQHAPRSTIKLFITDYSVPNNTKTVTSNIHPELAACLLDVCRKNITAQQPKGTYQDAITTVSQMRQGTVLPPNQPPNRMAEPILAVPMDLLEKLSSTPMPAEALQLAAMLNPITLPSNGPVYVGVSKRIVELLAQALSGGRTAGGVDYSYTQDRVNPYKEQKGLCPVSSLTISRTGTRKDGSVSQMPWSVNIKNFLAQPVRQANGMTSYNGRTIQGQKEAFILVSDMDMYRCTYRTARFVELWEMAVGIPLVKAGLKQKEAESRAQNGRAG